VLDEKGDFEANCNLEMVQLFPLDDSEEIAEVRQLVDRHAEWTDSERSRQVLADWGRMVPRFRKVYPNDYRRVIETQRRFKLLGLPDEEAEMRAFEENAHDAARVGGR
jgi:glutamate synthase (ferredoxin)